MNIIISMLTILEAVICFLLIGIILIQRSKGQGLGMSFGGGAGEAVFGAQMGNVLTRTTVILGVAFIVNTLLLTILPLMGRSAGPSSVVDNARVAKPVAAQVETMPAVPERAPLPMPTQAEAPVAVEEVATQLPATPEAVAVEELPAVTTEVPVPATGAVAE